MSISQECGEFKRNFLEETKVIKKQVIGVEMLEAETYEVENLVIEAKVEKIRGRAEWKSKLDYNLFLYLPYVYFYYFCLFVEVVYKALFCTLSSAILIGRADGVWIPTLNHPFMNGQINWV